MELGLSQSKIKEIKYEIKKGKTVVFKLNDSDLEDVEIICAVENAAKADKKYEKPSLNEIIEAGPPKHLNDYAPVCSLEEGVKQTLIAAKDKSWKNAFSAKKPLDATSICPISIKNNVSTLGVKLNADKDEISSFLKKQKSDELNLEDEYKKKVENKLAKELVKSRKIIDDFTEKMSNTEKENFIKRLQKNLNNDEMLNDEDKEKFIEHIREICVTEDANIEPLNEIEEKMLGDKKLNDVHKVPDSIIKAFKGENTEKNE